MTAFDWVCLSLALGSFAAYFVFAQGLLAAALVTGTDFLAFLPTIRKSWSAPAEETLSTYVLAIFSWGCTLWALSDYRPVTLLYPAFTFCSTAAFCAMVVWRRRTFAPAG